MSATWFPPPTVVVSRQRRSGAAGSTPAAVALPSGSGIGRDAELTTGAENPAEGQILQHYFAVCQVIGPGRGLLHRPPIPPPRPPARRPSSPTRRRRPGRGVGGSTG